MHFIIKALACILTQASMKSCELRGADATLLALRSLEYYTVSFKFERDLTCEERKALITVDKINVDISNPFQVLSSTG